MRHSNLDPAAETRRIWNVGQVLGSKHALFDLAIDSKLRGFDTIKTRIGDIASGGGIETRAIVVRQKTGKPVQSEILNSARSSLLAWLDRRGGIS